MTHWTKSVLAACIFTTLTILPAYADKETDLRLISVSGDAEVKVVPDEVLITLGVETLDKDLAKAKEENDQKVTQVIAAAQKLKIDAKNIQTDYISIQPDYESGSFKFQAKGASGYYVRKTLAITLKDISKFEELLSNVLGAGANYVHGIEFRTSELRKYRDQARAMAIKAAQEKATALAKELGRSIGRPYSIQEGRIGWWSGYSSWWGSRYGNQMSQNVSQNVNSPSQGDSTVPLGQISVTASVNVSFELE